MSLTLVLIIILVRLDRLYRIDTRILQAMDLRRATDGSAGYDFPIKVPEGKITINPGENYIFDTNVAFNIKKREYVKIYARSSLGLKHKCMLTNSVAIIDSDYFPNTIKDCFHEMLASFHFPHEPFFDRIDVQTMIRNNYQA